MLARKGNDQLDGLVSRELDDAVLTLRTNELELGLWLLKTSGNPDAVLKIELNGSIVEASQGLLAGLTIAASNCTERQHDSERRTHSRNRFRQHEHRSWLWACSFGLQ